MPSNKPSETAPRRKQDETDLAGYEVIVAVTGGIAAYKVCEVVSRLVQRGAGVTVAMTRSARRFITPLSLQALSGRPVLVDLWKTGDSADIQHIQLTSRADLVVVAPATANTIARIACGMADDVVTSLVISADSAVLVAPAMNDRMWKNAAVQRNVATLRRDGLNVVDPVEGWLACRSVGQGRMVEAAELLAEIAAQLQRQPPKAAIA